MFTSGLRKEEKWLFMCRFKWTRHNLYICVHVQWINCAYPCVLRAEVYCAWVASLYYDLWRGVIGQKNAGWKGRFRVKLRGKNQIILCWILPLQQYHLFVPMLYSAPAARKMAPCCHVAVTRIFPPIFLLFTPHFQHTHPGGQDGTTLTCPCSRCPARVSPGVSSSPFISGPNGTTSPVTSGSNSHVDLFQVYPL